MQGLDKSKILALYLPQFHQIPENDEWWAEGFTEWNVVKNAKRINKYTIQPRIPMLGYYDLSQKESIKQQTQLAKKYGIDGFVIYSYYSNGQLLLNKPAEIILENLDIDIDFCFSWANHDWMRTWFSYNREMLRKQEYASTREQVCEHFNYYLPFFKDRRYIKVGNKPALFIYDSESIPSLSLYMTVFDEMAMVAGFDGVYWVQTLGGHHLDRDTENFNAFFEYEPTYTTFSEMKTQHGFNRVKRGIKKLTKGQYIANYFDYNQVCNKMEARECLDESYILGSFAEWDNTPRHSHNGTVFKRFSIERFQRNISIQLSKAMKVNAPFIVIDAWNEWGEGAFLEPDKVYNLQKLEAIKSVVNDISRNNGF